MSLYAVSATPHGLKGDGNVGRKRDPRNLSRCTTYHYNNIITRLIEIRDQSLTAGIETQALHFDLHCRPPLFFSNDDPRYVALP